MRFLVVTYGTEGDTRPLSALCRALMDAGHEARLLADRATLGAAGVPTAALAGDIKAALPGDGSTGLAAAFTRIATANTAAWMRDIIAAGRGCDAILVSGLAAFAGLSAAEHLGVTAIGLGLIPITPTSAFPSPFLPPRLLPRWLDRTSHRAVNGLIWRAFRKATNAAREAVCGLPPRHSVWADHPMLYGISPSLVPRPEDWPETACICGQWLTPTADWAPPPELGAFLAAGEPPLYVGFGSMAGFDRRRMLGALIAAVAGRRAVFYPGWSGIDPAALPANFLAIGETPHDWLFPRTALVIHHGGSGTAHSAARAGVPSVVVPFAGDQPFWADRLRRARVAGPPISAKGLTVSALARGIDFAESAGDRAAALGRQMAAEDGVTTTIAAIETIMARSRP